MKRYATARWNGSGKTGSGYVTTPSTVLNQARYSFDSRFAAAAGTNPEELLAAAHAMCFTLKLCFVLEEAGYVPETLETTATVSFEMGAITASHLRLKARIGRISGAVFKACVREAEIGCPVSRVLNAEINVESWLEQ